MTQSNPTANGRAPLPVGQRTMPQPTMPHRRRPQRTQPPTTRGGAIAALCALALVGWWVLPAPAEAKVFLTADEALELAFPGCEVTRSTEFLSEAEVAEARELADAPVESGLVHPYRARCDGKEAGTAYFDVHRVRTLPERLMIVVTPEGKVARIEVLTFDEPQDYRPREGWYGQFQGHDLDDDLKLDGAIRGVAGATLTGRATARAVRRVLALHRVIAQRGDK